MIFILLILIAVTALDGFGLFRIIISTSTPIGNLSLSLVVFLYLIFTIITKIHPRNKIIFFDKSIKYYTYFIILLFFLGIKNILIDNTSITTIIRHFRTINMILYAYILISYIRTFKKLQSFINALLIVSIISSFVIIFQSLTGIKTSSSVNVSRFGSIYRVWNYSVWLIGIMNIYILSRLLTRFNISLFIIFMILFTAIFATLSRGLILSVFLGTLITIYYKSKYSLTKRSVVNLTLIGVVFIFGLIIINTFTNFKIGNFTERIETGNEQINRGKDVRIKMIQEKSLFLLFNEPLGVGFSYKDIEYDKEGEPVNWDYFDPYFLNGDSTYQNILLTTGLLGLFLFFKILYTINKQALKIYKESENYKAKEIALFIAASPIIILIYGMSGNLYSFHGFTIISIVIGILYLLKLFNTKIKSYPLGNR